jgi:hypothetical protein
MVDDCFILSSILSIQIQAIENTTDALCDVVGDVKK